MVEAALAIVVLAIGVLAVFVLFSTGLDTKTRATSDTQAALFADGVFNTLRAESAAASEENRWESFWEAMAGGTTNLPVAVGGPDGVWVDSNLVVRAGTLVTNIYMNYSLRLGQNTNIVSHSLRYQMDVSFEPADATWTNRANVMLRVWEGVFGSTNENGAVFYTEFNNPENL
jgi:hypothetical protein